MISSIYLCFLACQFNHFLRQLLELVAGFLVHRKKLPNLSDDHSGHIIHRKRLLLVVFHGFLHSLEHGSGNGFSRLFAAVHLFLNVPQDGKEHILDFFNLCFMVTHFLGVQELQVLSCFCPVFRVFFHQVGQGSRCHLDKLVSCCYALCRRILKINPYQIYQLRKIPVFQQAVEDLHINSTRHKPPHGSLGQA